MKRMKIAGTLVLAASLMGLAAAPASAQDAGDRYTILVPWLAPQGGADNDFGEDVAKELRNLINDLHTHQTVDDRALRDARRKYDVDEEALSNCITARQLAMQENWQLVVCGEYTEMGNRQVEVAARFVGAANAEEFVVPTFTANERDPRQAAQQMLQSFDQWQTALRHSVFCNDYIQSEQWEQALGQCEQALAINPEAASTLYQKAFILNNMERQEEALATVDQLLELDQIHENGLKLGGIIATTMGDRDRAREYFDRYMELNPGDIQVRLTIATDISNAGDYRGALRFAQEGLEAEPDNLNLITYIGHFAVNAASEAEAQLAAARNGGGTPGGTAPAEGTDQTPAEGTLVTELYETAVESYQRVFEEQGEETEMRILERMIVALFKLERYDEAVDLGQQATAMHPEEGTLWEAHSRALEAAGEAEEALAAIEQAQDLGRSSPALSQRKAMLQLAAGNTAEGMAALQEAVDEGLMDASTAFRAIFSVAYNDNYTQGNMNTALQLLDAAGDLATTEEDRLTRNFWRGYIVFQQAQSAHEPQTAESAARARPMFERALELFQAARGYEEILPSADVPSLIDAAQRFIEIQEALIRRGR